MSVSGSESLAAFLQVACPLLLHLHLISDRDRVILSQQGTRRRFEAPLDWDTVIAVNVGSFEFHWLHGTRYIAMDTEQPPSYFYSAPTMAGYISEAVAVWGCADVSTRLVRVRV